jgi:SAM-dependent methyltransferase
MPNPFRWLAPNSGRSDTASNAPQKMSGVNIYDRQLSDMEIAAGEHRNLVGGLWEEVGELQLRFLESRGLQACHSLADIGCGALRGGLHFIRFLEPDKYCGLDINASLIAAGQKEIEAAGIWHKKPNLLVDDQFDLRRFQRTFDYGIAVSLLTHLYLNHIARCFRRIADVMHPGSKFFCSFFESPTEACVDQVFHPIGGYTTYFDSDPFHQSFVELRDLASHCGLKATYIGEWGHPRDQRMLLLTPKCAGT